MALTTASQLISPKVNFSALKDSFLSAEPFDHVVIDDFFLPEIADGLAAEFPTFESDIWAEYNNPLEIKKTSNNWNKFPTLTYSVFSFLNSDEFVGEMSKLTGDPLYPDTGLHGGGWHTHRPGGKLNTHLDYSIHPKLKLERRLNLIVYIAPNWVPEWGGKLGLWEVDTDGRTPGKLAQEIDCLFNRAVIFDTSQNSWHGLPEPVRSPEGINRNSLATYYLCEPRKEAAERGRALFAPTDSQKGNAEIEELIKLRSGVNTSESVYRKP